MELKTSEFKLICAKCKTFLGCLSLAYFGVPHHTEPIVTCPNCLPNALNTAQERGVPQATIDKVGTWLEPDPTTEAGDG